MLPPSSLHITTKYVAEFLDTDLWILRSLPQPSTKYLVSPVDDPDKVSPRSVHFTVDGRELVVSYLNHGVMYV